MDTIDVESVPQGTVAKRDAQQPEPILAVIERAARDPNVDVLKMERLLEMAEKVHARQAEAAYDAAMNAAQSEMRPVARDSDNPQTRSRYASYGALDNALRPIYSTHGFALSFGTRSPGTDRVTITCRVSHRTGHSRDVEIEMPADGKGAKGGDVMTKTHATGSAVSYGMRYLLKMIFNVAVGEYDDDGNAASPKRKAPPEASQGSPSYPTPPSVPPEAAKPLKDKAKLAELCKKRFLDRVAAEKLDIWAWDWARENAVILGTERLDAGTAFRYPTTKEQFDIVWSDILMRKQKCIDGGGVPQELDEAFTKAYLPDDFPAGAETPKQAAMPRNRNRPRPRPRRLRARPTAHTASTLP